METPLVGLAEATVRVLVAEGVVPPAQAGTGRPEQSTSKMKSE